MRLKATSIWRRTWLSIGFGLFGLVLWGTSTWASTRIGDDMEFQAWYRTRNTFQTDSKHFDWVQWRNEGFVWFVDNGLVKKGTLQGTGIPIPLVEDAQLSARFRLRVDPVYYVKPHYEHLYDSNHQKDFGVPERDFRDLYVDMNHGEVGPGRLSTRWGYQQIVWGESDLYRSLDIINPLRIDQNLPIGEKFDEFRLPILAFKGLYDIGNVGEYFSNVGIEPFFTPRFRSGADYILYHDSWRIEYQERGCLPPGATQVLSYSPANCGKPGTKFQPYRPDWLGERRIRHPWEFPVIGNNARIDSADYACLTSRCAPDVPGDRESLIVNLPKGVTHHHFRGTDFLHNVATGTRITGTSWLGLDLSLNYIYLPQVFANTNPSGPLQTYGASPTAVGTLEEGLKRCLSDSGKAETSANGRSNGHTLVQLVGVDLRGYNWPGRRLNPDGSPSAKAKQPQAARPEMTLCTNGFSHQHNFTHVIGFAGTYNDSEYTGAVFRFEESLSTREKVDKKAIGYANNFSPTPEVVANRASFNNRILRSTPVWRSMLGFDLLQALDHYPGMGWLKHAPGDFGTQGSFLTFQWLMQYNFEGLSNNMCSWNFAMGTGATLPGEPGPQRNAIRGCTTKHWNDLFTLGLSGNGYFKSKLEQRLAVAYEPNGKQWLLYGQWWWRSFYNLPVDLSGGTSWFPSSRMDNSWTNFNYFVHRNLLWFEATYYIL